MARLFSILQTLVILLGCSQANVFADDDPIPPPLDPNPGYEGILPAPPLPPHYDRDQDTIPYGVQSVANTPALHLGQSFRPALSSIDWVAFVFQNSVQPSDPNPPGPGFLQVSLYSSINTSNGALSGLLGATEIASIPSQTTSWVVFHFPESISVVPGNQYYLHVKQTGGYQSWVGIRGSNIYNQGSAFGYFYDTVFNNPPQNLNWGGRDLHFAQGILEPPTGDFNLDGEVDAADYVMWRKGAGTPDAYSTWRNSFGSSVVGSGSEVTRRQPFVPEPANPSLLAILAAAIATSRRYQLAAKASRRHWT